MVHDGVTRRSDDEFSDVISRGTSGLVVVMLSGDRLTELKLVLWDECSAVGDVHSSLAVLARASSFGQRRKMLFCLILHGSACFGVSVQDCADSRASHQMREVRRRPKRHANNTRELHFGSPIRRL